VSCTKRNQCREADAILMHLPGLGNGQEQQIKVLKRFWHMTHVQGVRLNHTIFAWQERPAMH
jgi:hypothetical protein